MNLFNILAEDAGGSGGTNPNFATTSVCNDPDLAPMFDIVGTAIYTLLIIIPVLLVIFGLMDLMKAVMASKDDEIKAAQKLLMKRIIYTIFAFLIVVLVKSLVSLIDADNAEGIVSCINTMFD